MGAIEFLANFVEKSVQGLESMINGFIDLYNNSILFRGIINTIGAAFRTVFDTVQAFINLSLEGFSSIGSVIKAVLTGNFKELPSIIRDSASSFGAAVREVGADLAENYIDGFNNTFKPKLLDSFSFGNDSDLQQASTQSGAVLGNAFVKGYGETVKTSIQAISSEAAKALEVQLAENERLKELRDNTEGLQADSSGTESDEAKRQKAEADQAIALDQARIQSAASVASAVKQFAGERAEASKAALVVEKLAAATEIGLNLQREISGYWVNTGTTPIVGPGIATALSVAAGVRAALALANLAGFAGGGFTGNNGIPDPSLPSRNITGYVHNNEFVASAEALSTSEGMYHAMQLDRLNKGLAPTFGGNWGAIPGYASGGFTGAGMAAQSAISQSQLTNALRNALTSMPSPVVSVRDINTGQRQVQVVQRRGTI